MVTLYSETFNKYYYSTWISFPTWITIITILFILLFPFFIQFKHSQFWYTIGEYIEQPAVQYTNNYIVSVLKEKETSIGTSFRLLKEIKSENIVSDLLCTPTTTSKNNKADSFTCEGTMNTQGDIQNLQALLFFNYSLTERIKIHLQTACYININLESYTEVNSIETKGILKFEQDYPFVIEDFESYSLYSNLFSSDENQYFPSFDEIMNTFVFNYTYGTKYDYEASLDVGSGEKVKLKFVIDIPSYQEFIYYRTDAESIKYNWIEYLALFIPVSIICYNFLAFIFSQKIFQCTMMSDIPSKRL